MNISSTLIVLFTIGGLFTMCLTIITIKTCLKSKITPT